LRQIGEAFTAGRLVAAARFVIGLEPQLFARTQVGHDRQGQAARADTPAAEHAARPTRAHGGGEQFAAVVGKVG
jgi:hypothetical protein